MIGVLTLLIPSALAAYFIYQAARRPIFLLGIPFLQVMRESIFLVNLRPFWFPARLGIEGSILVWVVLAWAWCVVRSRTAGHSSEATLRRSARLLPEEYPLVALAVLVLAKLLWGGIGSADTQTLLDRFATWGLLLAGYWLVRGVVRRSSSQDVAAFLVAVAVATTIGSAVFIIHQGLHVPIYNVVEYAVFSFEGQTLSRTYAIISPFFLLPLAVGFARRSWSAGTITMVVVCVLAVAISYTRVFVLSAAGVLAVLVTLRSLKERRLDLLVRRSFTIAVVLATASLGMLFVMPKPTEYFLHRMTSFTRASTATQDQNILVRQSHLGTVRAVTSDRYWLVGAPFGLVDDMSRKVSMWSADSAWVGVMYWTGFAGVALVLGMFVLFGLRALGLFMNYGDSTEFVAAVCFAGIVAMFITSLAGWSFLEPVAHTMGFWLFAFVAGETIRGTELGPGAIRDIGAGVEETAGLGHGSPRPS